MSMILMKKLKLRGCKEFAQGCLMCTKEWGWKLPFSHLISRTHPLGCCLSSAPKARRVSKTDFQAEAWCLYHYLLAAFYCSVAHRRSEFREMQSPPSSI